LQTAEISAGKCNGAGKHLAKKSGLSSNWRVSLTCKCVMYLGTLPLRSLFYSATGNEDRINYLNFLKHRIFCHSDQIFYFAELAGKPGRELGIFLQLRGRDAYCFLCFCVFHEDSQGNDDGHKYVHCIHCKGSELSDNPLKSIFRK
jgi:hypothetical protein